MEIVKIGIKGEFSYQVDADLGLVVGKGAVLTVVTESCRREVALAELCFVFVRMVKLFDPGVAIDTGLPLRTLFLLRDKAAKLGRVQPGRSSTVLRLVMVVSTLLKIVVGIVRLATLDCLEGNKV